MAHAARDRSRDRRRWTLAFAYAALLASCDSPFAPDVQEVGRLDVTPPVLTMVVGGEATLVARAYDASDNLLPTARIFWSTQDPTVVSITQSGVVTAVGAGTAQLAASSGGQSRTIAVTVAPRPIALVRITPPAANVVQGQTFSLLGEAIDGTGTVLPGRVLDWTTSEPAIATVNASGVVTGISLGQATISAAGEGKVGTAIVTVVPAPVLSISIAPDGGSLPAGGTLTLTAIPRDANGTPLAGRTLQWRSSDDAVATVSGTGLLTAISPGTVTITVSAPGAGPDGSTPSASVTVTVLIEPVASAVIVPSPIGIQVAQTTNLTLNLFGTGGAPLSAAGRMIAWLSSDPSIVTVNESGAITGVGVGVATVTATITTPGQASPIEASTQVNVSNRPVASVVVTPNPAVVHAGYARPLTATALDANNQPLPGRRMVFTSSNQAIATVDAVTGVVAGVAPGNVQITATSEGIQGTTSIVVDLVPVSSVSMSPQGASLLPGQTQQFTAVPRDSAGTPIQGIALGGRQALWGTANAAAATVSVSGLVTAVAPGSSEISANIGNTVGRATVTVNALPSASQLSIVTQPSGTAQNDIAFGIQPVVQLKDANGNNVLAAGVTISAAITAPGSGVLGGTSTAVTNASGTATFTNLRITGQTGSRTLTFSSGALTPATSSAINVQPGVATQLAMVTPPPATANSGQVFSSPTVLQLRDVSGNTVLSSGALVTAAVTPSAGVTLGGAATTTTAGVATFGALTLTGPAASYTLTFSSGALPTVSSGPITLSAGSGSKLSITTQPSATTPSGQVIAQQPVIQLRDGSDNPVAQAGVVVSAAILSGGGTLGGTTTATTGPTGQATFTNLSISGTVGTRTLLFGASGFTAVTSNNVSVTAGAPAILSVTTQPPATVASGSALAPAPVVRVTDAASNGVAGVMVTASIASGGGTLSGGATATTDANGNATFNGLTITGLAGSKTLGFTAGALSATSSAIQLTAGPAASLAITTPPTASVANDVVFPQQPVIQVLDASGNGVPNVIVTAAITSGGGTLGGTTQATTNASGVASFVGLKITGGPGPRTLSFSSGSLTPATASVTLTVGAAASLMVTTAPQSPVANDAILAPQPAVTVTDVSGTPVPGALVTVAITAGGGTLGGTTSATTGAQGVATFTGLKITGTIGVRTLTFTTGSLTATATVDVTPGSATQLALTTAPPASVASGTPFSAVVQLRDVSGNSVAAGGVPISVALTSGGGTFSATTPVATSAGGAATFSDLQVTGLAGARQLTFSSSGLAPIVAPVSLAAGPAATLVLATPPSASVPNDAVFPQQPVVQVQDAAGNLVPAVTVTASISAGGGTLGGTVQAVSNASGLASFAGLKITGSPGPRTLSFSSGSLTPVTASVTLTVGAAASLAVQQAPQSPVANDVAFAPQPVLIVTDVSGTPVPGVSVGVAITAGGGVLGGTTSATSDAFGLAAFAGLKITGAVGARTLTFTAGSLTATANVNVTAGVATQLALTAPPPANVQSGAPFSATVQLQDVSGNNVSAGGVSVGVVITSGAGMLSGTTVVATSGSGAAAFTDLAISGSLGAHQLTFSSGSLASVAAATNVTPGAAATLTLTTPPTSSVPNDAVFPQQPVVLVEDATANPVPNVTVTVSITAGGGTLGGTAQATTNASGVATFSGLKITGAVGVRTLTFAGASLSATANVDVTAGAPTQLVITAAPPASVASSSPFSAVVQLRDVSGNDVPQSGVGVTATLSPGTLGGTTTMATDANGSAAFGDLSITGGAGPYTITFTAGVLTAQASISVAFYLGNLDPHPEGSPGHGVLPHGQSARFVTTDSAWESPYSNDGTRSADLNTSVLVWNHSRGRRA